MHLPAMQDLEVALCELSDVDVNCKALGKGNLWPLLRTLKLPSAYIGSRSFVPLMLADWQLLSEIDLSSNCLDCEAIGRLAACKWPQLISLSLADNSLDDKAAEHMVSGHWPMLKKLDLSFNHLDHVAMVHLVKGQWPLLKLLHLDFNHLDIIALQIIMQGQWPKLSSLHLQCCNGLACRDIVEVCNTARSESCLFAHLLLSKAQEYTRAVAEGRSDTVSLMLNDLSAFA